MKPKILLRILLMASVYYGTGLLSLMLLGKDSIITVAVFAPEGFALAAALIYGRSILPGIFLGQLLLALSSGLPVFAAVDIGLVNTVEAAIAIFLFHRFKFNIHLSTSRDFFGLILLVLLILQPFSAFFGNLILYMYEVEPYSSFLKNLFFWWFGNVIGQLLFTPILLIVYDNRKNINLLRLFLTVVIFTCYNYLLQGVLEIENVSILLILTLPLTVYLAAYSLLYASIATVTLSIVSTIMVHLGIGLFARSASEVDNIINLNFFILSHTMLVLLVGILFKEKEEAIKHLKSMAHYDYLTGLPNRHLLQEKIHHSIYLAKINCKQNAICFIDLDGFKEVNDTFGHHVGDELLKEVSCRLQAFVSDEDELLRIGGDEFVMIFNGIDRVDIFEKQLDDLLEALCKIKRIEGCPVNISASIGIAWCPQTGLDGKALIEIADNAMYKAKKQGKNCYVFGS